MSAAVPVVLQGRRVLVVDDEEDSRELIGEILEEAGAEVRTAGNAERALVELAAFDPHVLVCDVSMPGEDGYSLMRRIRARKPEPGWHVAAAALTAYARDEDRERALAAGFDLHVTKPIEAVAFALAIAALADRPRTNGAVTLT